MATKAQKRAAGEAKRVAYEAQVRADGLAALEADQEKQKNERAAMKAHAAEINARHNEIFEAHYLGVSLPVLRALKLLEANEVNPKVMTLGELREAAEALVKSANLGIGEVIANATKAVEDFDLAFNAPVQVKPDHLTAIQRVKAASVKKRYETKPMFFDSTFEKTWPFAPDDDEVNKIFLQEQCEIEEGYAGRDAGESAEFAAFSREESQKYNEARPNIPELEENLIGEEEYDYVLDR